jgi:hypothetical protein
MPGCRPVSLRGARLLPGAPTSDGYGRLKI